MERQVTSNDKTKSMIPPKNKPTQPVKKKKKKGKGKFIILVIILIIAAIGACIFFNVGGIQKKALSTIGIKVGSKAVSEQVEDTGTTKEELEALKSELDAREQDLNAREEAINAKEQEQSGEQLPNSDGTNSDGTENTTETNGDTQSVQAKTEPSSGIFESMDAKKAAAILFRYNDNEQIAHILLQLSEGQSAEILSSMTADQASTLIKLMDEEEGAQNDEMQ